MPEPLVVVPGTLCSPAVADRLAAALGADVAVDGISWMNGPGPWTVDAVADAVATRIRAVHGRPVLVLGHSSGGAVALRLAIDHPDVVAGLMVMNSGPSMAGHGDVDAVVAALEGADPTPVHAAVIDRSFHVPPAPDVRAALLAYAATAPAAAAIDMLRSQRALDLTPELVGVACPAVVVHGVHDRVRSVAGARELAAALPDAELLLVAAGHTPLYERPSVVAAAVHRLAARA